MPCHDQNLVTLASYSMTFILLADQAPRRYDEVLGGRLMLLSFGGAAHRKGLPSERTAIGHAGGSWDWVN
jgi:hypothetical protein